MTSKTEKPVGPIEKAIVRFLVILAQLGAWACTAALTALSLELVIYIREPHQPTTLVGLNAILNFAFFILLCPIVINQFNAPRKWAAYIGIPLGFSAMIWTMHASSRADDAYAQTPAGKVAAAETANRDKDWLQKEKEDAARDAELAGYQREADEAKAIEEARQKEAESVEDCFSTFRKEIPALTDQVRDSLENPASFEHVKTTGMGKDPDGRNVKMEFRGQNGMGAIITVTIRAHVNVESCEVDNIGEIID